MAEMKFQKRSMGWWLVTIFGLGFFMCAAVLFITRGTYFNRLFFHASNDTGMDFFHSIEYVRGRKPYELFNTLYPPLANMFFYVLFRFVPSWQYETWMPTFTESVNARGTAIDLRVWQPTMVLFIVFVAICVVAMVLLVQNCTNSRTGVNKNLFSVSVLLSYGVLYSLERGNIIIISFLCCLFFVRYKDSKNRVLSTFAIVMLAVSAGLKIYPALLGMMLLYDKQYKKAFITIGLGVASLVLPTLIFHEGLSGVGMFLKKLSSHSDTAAFVTDGFSFDRICNTVIQLIASARGVEVGESSMALSSALAKLNLPMAALTLGCGFYMEKQWQKTLACCTAMMLYSFQYPYGMIFFLIPLLIMVAEEGILRKDNAFMFFTLLLATAWLPIVDITSWPVSLIYGRFQICIVLFTGYIFLHAGRKMVKDGKKALLKMQKRKVFQ